MRISDWSSDVCSSDLHLHDVQLEHSRLRQQPSQSTELQARLSADLAEITQQAEEFRAVREEPESRFEELDVTLGEHKSRFADADMSGADLARDAEPARQQLRDGERTAQESGFAERD